MTMWLLATLAVYLVGVAIGAPVAARQQARDAGYSCRESAGLDSYARYVKEPCPPDAFHRDCRPRTPREIGSSGIGYAMTWPITVPIWLAFLAWDGLSAIVGRSSRTVDQRRLAQLERELGIGEEGPR